MRRSDFLVGDVLWINNGWNWESGREFYGNFWSSFIIYLSCDEKCE